jgi:MFS family permease
MNADLVSEAETAEHDRHRPTCAPGGQASRRAALLRSWPAQWLPPDRRCRWLVIASFVDSLGTGLFIAGSALFFTKVIGLSTAQIGIGLTLAGIAGLTGAVPIGRVADRIGGKPALVGLYTWRGVCFAIYPFVHDAPTFYVVAFLIGVAEWSSGPITQSVVGAFVSGESRVRTMAAIGSVRNVGFTIGALLATFVLAAHSAVVFSGLVFADAATFLGAAAVLSRLPMGTRPSTGPAKSTKGGPRVRDPMFLSLTALNGVLYIHSILLTVGLPLWISTHTSAPLPVVGVVVVINTIMVILLQVPLSKGVSGIRPAARRQLWSSWGLAACCALVAFTHDTGKITATVLLVAAAVAMTLGEIWQSIGAWGISYALAPQHRQASYLSVYHLGLTGSSVVGPALITIAVIGHGAVGWLGLCAVILLAGLGVRVIAHRSRPVNEDDIAAAR